MSHPLLLLSMPAATPAMRTGRLSRWLMREGDALRAGDPVAEIAGDGFTMDVEAPESGVLTRIVVPEGAENIAVGATLGLIAQGPVLHHFVSLPVGQGGVSPRARRLARDHGVDLAGVQGSGPSGRIIERDLRAALAHTEPEAAAVAPPLAAAPAQAGPQVCLELDCEIDAADALRAQLRATASAGESGLDLVDCALRAFALALQAVPLAHVAYGDGGFVPARTCDIGLALASGGRTTAPALRAVEHLSLRDIALARRGPSGAEAFGGSALLIDARPLGVVRLFPALSAPWTAILALGATEPRVVVRAGAPAVARAMSVTLTFDPRAIDAVDAAQVLRLFKTLMENPARLAI
jgi:pyruvate dehydrogenase E2 component (dihydrolipoamide acetyltransferase)